MLTLAHPVELVLEKLMQETLHDHHASISTSGRPVGNVRFTDDIDFIGGSNDDIKSLTNRLVGKAMAY